MLFNLMSLHSLTPPSADTVLDGAHTARDGQRGDKCWPRVWPNWHRSPEDTPSFSGKEYPLPPAHWGRTPPGPCRRPWTLAAAFAFCVLLHPSHSAPKRVFASRLAPITAGVARRFCGFYDFHGSLPGLRREVAASPSLRCQVLGGRAGIGT